MNLFAIFKLAYCGVNLIVVYFGFAFDTVTDWMFIVGLFRLLI